MFTLRQFVRLSVVPIAGLLAFSATLAAQTLESDELESLVENASTKAPHLKIAGHYTAEAEQLRQDASRHDSMAARYKNVPTKAGRRRPGLAKHCEDIATSLRYAAMVADQLASAHRESAEESE